MNTSARFGPALFAVALVVLVACAPGPTPTAPTVGAAATAAATAAQPASAAAVAAASPAATQAAAAASPAASTVVAAASPAATAAAGAAPTAATQVAAAASPVATAAAGASPVRITDARLDPSDATFTLRNVSSTAVDLTGWRLRVGAATAALPSGARVAPGESVTIHTASGTATTRDIYLGQEASALVGGLRPGATLTLVDAQGNTVAEFTVPG